MRHQGKLRVGFTTGSAAAAAAKAALVCLLSGDRPARVDIPVPEGRSRLVIRVQWPDTGSKTTGSKCQAGPIRGIVCKDAGDDPDVTDKARIEAVVRFIPDASSTVVILGGRGVGLVTRQGLPVAVGEAAINPGPHRQIERAVLETLNRYGILGKVEILVEAPAGEALAGKTFNSRLGIEGGISILGTRGTVKPFSHGAWRKTIIQCLEVARANGCHVAALSTGGRGQKFLQAALRDCRTAAFVQAGDHIGFALRRAATMGFAVVIWGGFWGKLVKLAQGRPQTHARLFTVDLPGLADLASACGVDRNRANAIAMANTARHALGILASSTRFDHVLHAVMRLALKNCRAWTGPGPGIELMLFDFDGRKMQHATEVQGLFGQECDAVIPGVPSTITSRFRNNSTPCG